MRGKLKSDNKIIQIKSPKVISHPPRTLSPKQAKQYPPSKNINEDFFQNKIINNTGNAKSFCKKYDRRASETDNSKITLDLFEETYTGYEDAIVSNKSFGFIKSYALNTYIGLCKENNEDKIVVVNPIKKPEKSNIRNWPKMSYFGIFDGHGGENCSNFLRDNLLFYIVENKEFPLDIKTSIIKGFENAEKEFLKCNEGRTIENLENSGSCALIIIIVDCKIYIGNIGDSRAILSMEGGTKIKPLTIDHKPNNPKEYARIIKSGAKVFLDEDGMIHDKSELKFIEKVKDFDIYCNSSNSVFREYPSEMSVSRSIGDIKFKKKEYNGVPGSLISAPEIFIMDIFNYYDFIVMGCDGIFDFLNNNQIVDCISFIVHKLGKEKKYDIHALTKDACDMVIKYALKQTTEDNLSCIVIGLEGLEKVIKTNMAKEKINLMGK